MAHVSARPTLSIILLYSTPLNSTLPPSPSTSLTVAWWSSRTLCLSENSLPLHHLARDLPMHNLLIGLISKGNCAHGAGEE